MEGSSVVGQVLYKTQSFCSFCTLIERKGLIWKPASVVIRGKEVWLVTHCSVHGDNDLRYCSSETFFRRMLSYSQIQKDTDIEDLKSKLPITPQNHNYPLVVEFPIWKDNTFLSDDYITTEIQRISALYPKPHKFVLKIQGKLATDIPKLNEKVLLIENLLPAQPLLVEVSYERLVLLSRLENSIFTKAWIFPALKYYLRKGDEVLCLSELEDLFENISEFKGIQIVISLIVNRPFPDTSQILSRLRQQSGFVKFIILQLERPPVELIDSLKQKYEKYKNSSHINTPVSEKVQTVKNTDSKQPTSKHFLQTSFLDQKVKPGGSFETVRKIDEVGTVLSWEFRTKDHDIGFSISFEGLDSFESKDAVAFQRYSSQLQTVKGEFVVEQLGIYKLRWDNSYSRLRAKQLSYLVNVVLPFSTQAGQEISDELDPVELLQEIENATQHEITVDDFVPVSIGRIFEPFLASLQYGQFTIRPSPFCGFGTCLVNVDPLVKSTPISKFVDLDKFYTTMLPHMPKLEKSLDNLVKGFFTAKKVNKLLKKCAKENPPFPLPDLVSYLVDPTKADVIKNFFDNLQFLIVHNSMDIASVDLVRRCNCTSVTGYKEGTNSSGMAASCVGCV